MRSTLLLVSSLVLAATPAFADVDESEELPLPDLGHELEHDAETEADALPESSPLPSPEVEPEPEPEPAHGEAETAQRAEGRSEAGSGDRAEVEPKTAPLWDASVGLRMAFIASKGFDPFASNNALPQLSLGFGAEVYRREELSIATVGHFGVGGRSATARGDATSLTALSLGVGPELRYHLGESAWLHLRPSFDVTQSRANIDDASSGASLSARTWHIGFDAMAGAAASLGRPGPSTEFWLLAEAGYTWSSASALDLLPDGDEGSPPVHTVGLSLGKLAYRGPAFRVAAAIRF